MLYFKHNNPSYTPDRKIIRISEAMFHNLIMEAMSINDIHDKYYNNIPKNTFTQIIQADPTYRQDKPDKMGKYGKWLLNIATNNPNALEDLDKANQYLSIFDKYKNVIEIKDINQYKSLPDLYNTIEQYMNTDNTDDEQATSKSDQIRKIKQGAEKVYEDDEWLIIVPHTQEASCYYGKGTQWCTASTSSNNYFNHYNDRGNIYININKKTNKKYQFHIETNSFMDETDSHIAPNKIGLSPGAMKFYDDKSKIEEFTCGIKITQNINGHIIHFPNGETENANPNYDWEDWSYCVVGYNEDAIFSDDMYMVIHPNGNTIHISNAWNDENVDYIISKESWGYAIINKTDIYRVDDVSDFPNNCKLVVFDYGDFNIIKQNGEWMFPNNMEDYQKWGTYNVCFNPSTYEYNAFDNDGKWLFQNGCDDTDELYDKLFA